MTGNQGVIGDLVDGWFCELAIRAHFSAGFVFRNHGVQGDLLDGWFCEFAIRGHFAAVSSFRNHGVKGDLLEGWFYELAIRGHLAAVFFCVLARLRPVVQMPFPTARLLRLTAKE